MTEIAGIEDYAYAYSPNFRDAGADHPYWGDRGFKGSSAIPDRTASERHYTSGAKRAKREELEEDSLLSVETAPAPKAPLRQRISTAVKSPYFFEDLGFNIMNYVLVPISAVTLFALYVYAEVARSTGY
jgi:hypothetical protein